MSVSFVKRIIAFCRKRRVPIILALIILFHTVGMFWFLASDHTPLYKDVGHQYQNVLRIHRDIRHGGFAEIPSIYMDSPVDDGPTFQTAGLLLGAIFGLESDVITAANMIFLVALVLGTYALGHRLFSEQVGLLAATLAGCYPAVFYASRIPVVDLALASFVTLAMLWLFRTDGFSSRRESVILGGLLALAALSKMSFSLFLLVPYLVIIIPGMYRLFKEKAYEDLRVRTENLLVSLGISLVLVLPWYLRHLPQFVEEFLQYNSIGHSLEGMVSPVSVFKILFGPLPGRDPLMLFQGLFSNILFVLFSASIVYFLWRGRHRWSLLGWMLPAFLFFPAIYSTPTLLSPGSLRYFTPIFPVVSLIIAFFVIDGGNRLGKVRWGASLRTGAIIFLVVLHVNLYVAVSTNGHLGWLPFTSPLDSLYTLGAWEAADRVPTIPLPFESFKPAREHLRLEEATAQILAQLSPESSSPEIVTINPEQGRFGHAMEYQLGKQFILTNRPYSPAICEFDLRQFTTHQILSFESPQKCSEALRSAKVLILDPHFEWEYPTSASWDGPSLAVFNELLSLPSTRLLYAAPAELPQAGGRSAAVDSNYLWTDESRWGDERWQVEITAENLETFAGLILVMDSRP